MNSYKNPSHEIMAKEIALHYSFDRCSIWAHVCFVHRLIGLLIGISTTVFDAYITPTVHKYVFELKEFTGDIQGR